jgi:hypothetical protein
LCRISGGVRSVLQSVSPPKDAMKQTVNYNIHFLE